MTNNNLLTVLQGDCREILKQLPDGSVHCCVTSPPYWGLRAYLAADHPAKHLEIGQEATPEAFVAIMVQVFSEVRRVLRDDGTLWLNLGDSYFGSWGNYGGGNRGAGKQRLIKHGSSVPNPVWDGLAGHRPKSTFKHPSLKPKDLIGIPWRTAFALQSAGWYLRSDIVWAKPNSMPESVTDRCTRSHEYIFLLSKSQTYFYDAEAIKEPASENDWEDREGRGYLNGRAEDVKYTRNGKVRGHPREQEGNPDAGTKTEQRSGMRNKRDVWTVSPANYKEAHFATFPPDLIKPCILAGTSAKGCCPKCGAPWMRITERDFVGVRNTSKGSNGQQIHREGATHDLNAIPSTTVGWKPTCACGIEETVPCTVLDPFGGSGTTGEVALELGRKAVLIELNPEYHPIIERRCNITPGLPL